MPSSASRINRYSLQNPTIEYDDLSPNWSPQIGDDLRGTKRGNQFLGCISLMRGGYLPILTRQLTPLAPEGTVLL
jgi:hypothetical protein